MRRPALTMYSLDLVLGHSFRVSAAIITCSIVGDVVLLLLGYFLLLS